MVRIKSVSILELQNSAWLTVSVSKCLLSLIEVMETPLGKRTRARTCVPSGDSSAQFLVSDSCRAESSPTFTTVHPLALRLQNQSCRFMGAPPLLCKRPPPNSPPGNQCRGFQHRPLQSPEESSARRRLKSETLFRLERGAGSPNLKVQEAQWTLSDPGRGGHPKHWLQNRNKAAVSGPDHARLKMYRLGLWGPDNG